MARLVKAFETKTPVNILVKMPKHKIMAKAFYCDHSRWHIENNAGDHGRDIGI